MILPILERPDAEAAPGSRRGDADRLDRRQRPVRGDGAAARARTGATRSPTRRGRCTCSALQAALPGSELRVDDPALPMLRAVKDADEIERLAAAGAAADATLEEIVQVRFAGRTENEVGRRPRRAAAQARALAGRLHGRRLGPERRQPAPRGGRADDRGGRHGRAGLRRPQGRLRLGHHAHRARRRADRRGARGLRDRPPRPAGRLRGRAARASPARRSTARRAR